MSYFDPYRKWLGIAPKDQPPHHYRLLGVDLFESDPDVIEAAADQRMTYLHSCAAGEQVELGEKLLDEVSAARIVLLDPRKKSTYDANLRERLAASVPLISTVAESTSEGILAQPFAKPALPHSLHPNAATRQNTNVKNLLVIIGGVAAGAFVLVGVLIVVLMATVNSGDDSQDEETRDEFISQSEQSEIAHSVEPAPVEPANANSPIVSNTPKQSWDIEEGKQPGFAVAPFDAEQARKYQVEAAKQFEIPVEFVNSNGIRFRLVPPGEYSMGGAGGRESHTVRFDQPFYLSVYEISQYQYFLVTDSNPSGKVVYPHPVTKVSWQDAVSFCERLNNLPEEKHEGRVYRLPTEAMWEYACRAGSTSKYSFGDDDAALGDHAWISDNSDEQPQTVGSKLPNAWGFYDMHGNVWEWCEDWYRGNYASYETPFESVAEPGGKAEKVIRGGSVTGGPKWGSASTDFWRLPPSGRAHDVGFRAACMISMPINSRESSATATAAHRGHSTSADKAGENVYGSPFDLLRIIDPATNQVVGDWRFEQGSLIAPKKLWARLQVPYAPPDQYMLTARVRRIEGPGALGFGLVVGGRQVMLVLDSWQRDEVTAIEKVDGHLGASASNPTRVVGRRFGDNKPHTVVCTVLKNGIQVTFDSKTIISWRGDPTRLSLFSDRFRMPREDQLFLTSYLASFRIHSLTITSIN